MFGGSFNGWLPSDAAKGVVSALERTGEAISKGATQAAQSSRSSQVENAGEQKPKGDVAEGESADGVKNDSQQADSPNTARRKEMMGKLRGGWSSVMSATKSAIDQTREAVEKEQSRIFARGPYKRDPKLPLDVDALRDAEVVYVTDRLITMSHPAMQSSVDGDITPDRKLAAVGHLLQRRHGGRYMVWNLSEVEYDVDVLDDQVLTFQFPGSPSPPLGLLLKLLISMESWLKADDRNVAVVHCLTGRGRTSTVVAAFLCWTGEAGFHDVNSALAYVARCKHVSTEELTIPSQRRYVSYFANMLDGVRPSQPPLMLKRIILSEAPKFAKGPPSAGATQLSPTSDGVVEEDALRMGCAPYLQIFKAGQLLFTTAATRSFNQPKDELPFCTVNEGAISFHTESVVQGDILIRCRHLSKSGQRVSMFRAAFHTGYVPPSVLRLSKEQLDGACNDTRFPEGFYVDLIFEPCDAEIASKHLLDSKKEDKEDKLTDSQNDAKENVKESEESNQSNNSSSSATVTASEYDSMLHRDSRFWDVISMRRKEQASKSASDKENISWGPTIGRRRAWDDVPDKKSNKKDGKGEGNSSAQETTVVERPSALDTFSIGDFDFLPEDVDGAAKQTGEETPAKSPAPKQRDELMEALMAIEDETALSPQAPKKTVDVETEEIVFSAAREKNVPKPTGAPLPLLHTSSKSTEPSPKEEAAKTEVKEERSGKKLSKSEEAPTQLLADADLDVDVDVDAFLASAGDNNDVAEVDNLDDLLDLEDDDADLEDLENFLTQSGK